MKRNLPVSVFNEIKSAFAQSKHDNLKVTINARAVHEWLGVGRDFSNWMKARIEKFGFIEGVDYCIVENLSSPDLVSSKSRRQVMKDYFCVPDMVKQLAMIENSDKGRLVRMYFLDCEQIAIGKQEAIEQRRSMAVEFRPMTDAISCAHEDPKPYHYSNEADMINRIVLGMTSAQFKQYHSIGKDDAIRDFMTREQMKAIIDLQRANTVFITMGMEYQERKYQISKLFDKAHKQRLIDEFHRLEA